MEENTTTLDIRAINEKIERESAFIDLLTMEMNKVIVGQKHMVERLLIGLLGQGHILLEGVPGLAKTLAINTLSQAVQGSFSRIQFTPDLLPADVLLLHRPSPLMQADEIAEAVEKLKSEGKIIDFGVPNFTSSQTELIRQKTPISYNQIQFSATDYQPMLDGSLDYMQLHQIRPLSWNPLGSVFRQENMQTYRLRKLLATLVSKYEIGADTILLAWILKHPAHIIPIAGTVNVARIQSLMKATELQLSQEDWFAIWTESMGNEVP